MSDKDIIFEVFLKEYDKLKSEQSQRIGFRDNLLYVTLGLFGTIVSFAVSKQANHYALLVLPWVSLILGWTYVVNDEKISALGKYIRTQLAKKVKEKIEDSEIESVFSWESYRRVNKGRKPRKIKQFIVNQIAFVVPGIVTLLAFCYLVPKAPNEIKILAGTELVLLLILAIEIWNYADFADLKSELEQPSSETTAKIKNR
jgi:hypothetical protein